MKNFERLLSSMKQIRFETEKYAINLFNFKFSRMLFKCSSYKFINKKENFKKCKKKIKEENQRASMY